MARFLTPNSPLPSAPDTLYANGQNIGRANGKERIYHSGGWLGVTTFYARYPAEQFSTVLLCNDVSLSPSSLSEQMSDFISAREVTLEEVESSLMSSRGM